MTWRNKRDHINNYTCKWRNSDLGKTKPNHHYFMRWSNAYEQGNYVSIHSEKFNSKDKKYQYY